MNPWTAATLLSSGRRPEAAQPTPAMNASETAPSARHAGPHLGALAIVFAVLFNAGLCAVSAFGVPFGVQAPWFPGPWEPVPAVAAYFQGHSAAVALSAALQFGAMIPLGIYAATAYSRFRFLGITAAGPAIALFGGFLTVFDSTLSHLTLWVMSLPALAHDPSFLAPLYFIAYAFGGPGFSVPMGLLIAGLAVPAAFRRLLPRWLVVSGLVLAGVGELSWLHLLAFPHFLFLIPLTRFPAFIWLIAAGFALPVARPPARTA
jgi:hypothetical protein